MVNRMDSTTQLPQKPHPRELSWYGTACIALGGSDACLFTIGALLTVQGGAPTPGTMAIPLLALGVILSWMAIPGWLELVLMFPNRVGGIAATCSEAFRPYSEVLANLTGMCYWWGWAPAIGVSAFIAAVPIQQWYLPQLDVLSIATVIILFCAWINIRGIHFTSLVAIPIATVAGILAFISGLVPIFTGHMSWIQATDFHLTTPFAGKFGELTSLMAGLYLIGFAAPAFEQAFCHVGELRDPIKDQPRAVYLSAVMAGVYFILLPIVWLGTAGPVNIANDLIGAISPTFAPVAGAAAKAVAIWFYVFSASMSTVACFAGCPRTLLQLADDGLLPRIFSKRTASDAPSFATFFTMAISVLLLWTGSPLWSVASANFTYLIGVCLPSVAVWLLRKDQPGMARPWRAPRGTIALGLIAAAIWGCSTIFGFEQYGLPSVISGIVFAYTGTALYVWRKVSDRVRQGLPFYVPTLHLKLTGAMLMVLVLDAAGYLIAVYHVPAGDGTLLAILSDIFVTVAILTIGVGLILPGMIANSATQLASAANSLTTGTMADFSRAMLALGKGDLEAAQARIKIKMVDTHSNDEIGEMAKSFNKLQLEIMRAAVGLGKARLGLQTARDELLESNKALAENEVALLKMNETLEERVQERTAELESAQQQL
ncbi:MAG: amino acid permease, partial [Gammaproteobacteria bacterium]